MNRTYLQLSANERYFIGEFVNLGVSIRRIARMMKRSPSTISRELRRNLYRGKYRHEAAEVLALKRRHRKRGGIFSSARMRSELYSQLSRKWSPDQIAGRHRIEGLPFASRSTIYRYLKGKPKLRKWLRGITEKRKRDQKRERIHSPRMIDERPDVVDKRCRTGDWEGDTIRGPMSSRECVATFVERQTRFLVARKMGSVTSRALNKEAKKGLSGLPILTLTVDNGMEFGGFKKLESLLGTTVYFGHPRCPWERGLNENTNGLLRQYFPKGTNFAGVSDQNLLNAVIELNDRPRKCLNYQTPKEAFESALLHLT